MCWRIIQNKSLKLHRIIKIKKWPENNNCQHPEVKPQYEASKIQYEILFKIRNVVTECERM